MLVRMPNLGLEFNAPDDLDDDALLAYAQQQAGTMQQPQQQQGAVGNMLQSVAGILPQMQAMQPPQSTLPKLHGVTGLAPEQTIAMAQMLQQDNVHRQAQQQQQRDRIAMELQAEKDRRQQIQLEMMRQKNQESMEKLRQSGRKELEVVKGEQRKATAEHAETLPSRQAQTDATKALAASRTQSMEQNEVLFPLQVEAQKSLIKQRNAAAQRSYAASRATGAQGDPFDKILNAMSRSGWDKMSDEAQAAFLVNSGVNPESVGAFMRKSADTPELNAIKEKTGLTTSQLFSLGPSEREALVAMGALTPEESEILNVTQPAIQTADSMAAFHRQLKAVDMTPKDIENAFGTGKKGFWGGGKEEFHDAGLEKLKEAGITLGEGVWDRAVHGFTKLDIIRLSDEPDRVLQWSQELGRYVVMDIEQPEAATRESIPGNFAPPPISLHSVTTPQPTNNQGAAWRP